MKYLLLSLYSLSILINASAATMPANGDQVVGIWWTDDKRAKVEIYKKGDEYWGKIVWLEKPENEDGTPKLDKHNPDESKRTEPILGLHLISGFKYEGDKWTDGEIYNPVNGKVYDSVMKLKRGKLEVRGYVRLVMFGRTVVWTRAE